MEKLIRRSTFRLLSSPVFWAIIAINIFVYGLYYSLLEARLTETRQEIEQYLSEWEESLSASIIETKNIELTKNIMNSLKVYPVSNYKLSVEQKPLLSSSNHFFCNESLISKIIRFRTVSIGSIDVCLDRKKIITSTLTSPVFSITIILCFVLLVSVSIIPLYRYRNSFKKALDSLETLIGKNAESLVIPDSLIFYKEESARLHSLANKSLDSRNQLVKTRDQQRLDSDALRLIKAMAHDLRSPAVSLSTKIYRLENIDIASKTSLMSTLSRIVEICNDVLDLSKNKNLQINKVTALNITPLISELINEKKAVHPNIDFIFNQKARIMAFCSQEDFKRILSNIITNSTESMLSSSNNYIKVSIKTTKASTEVLVTDNGKGISQKHLSKVFNEGFTTKNKEGSGIGLFQASKKIDEWGGSIHLESEQNKGTKVKIDLPI